MANATDDTPLYAGGNEDGRNGGAPGTSAAGGGGAGDWGTPAAGAPTQPGAGSTSGDDSGGNTVKTLADLISQGLNAGGVMPQTIIQPTDQSGGGGLNLTTVLVVAGLGLAGWMLYKKFGKGTHE